MEPTVEASRAGMLEVLARTGLSRRALSRAMGRDPGYVAALLDPSRPARAWPTPVDLVRVSDAAGIPFVELLELVWGIDRRRLLAELQVLGLCADVDERLAALSSSQRAQVKDFIAFLANRTAARE